MVLVAWENFLRQTGPGGTKKEPTKQKGSAFAKAPPAPGGRLKFLSAPRTDAEIEFLFFCADFVPKKPKYGLPWPVLGIKKEFSLLCAGQWKKIVLAGLLADPSQGGIDGAIEFRRKNLRWKKSEVGAKTMGKHLENFCKKGRLPLKKWTGN